MAVNIRVVYAIVEFYVQIKKLFDTCGLVMSIGLLIVNCKNLLSRAAHITLYNAFIRPHLDYGDILFDQEYSMAFY